jgi:hypothetical protein
MPPDVLPMLADRGIPSSLDGWSAEPKLDGWRARVLADEGQVRLRRSAPPFGHQRTGLDRRRRFAWGAEIGERSITSTNANVLALPTTIFTKNHPMAPLRCS